MNQATSTQLSPRPRPHGLSNTPSIPSFTTAMASAMPQDSKAHTTYKFPAFQPDLLPTYEEEEPFGVTSSRSPSPIHGAQANGSAVSGDRWQPRKEARHGYMNGPGYGNASARHGHGHGRQKSLSEAIRTIRTRKASVSQNAHEIADALKAPLSPMLIVCLSDGYTRDLARLEG